MALSMTAAAWLDTQSSHLASTPGDTIGPNRFQKALNIRVFDKDNAARERDPTPAQVGNGHVPRPQRLLVENRNEVGL